ncbi:hypothetical protein Tco_0543405 [Tanacetum coccineum]
MSGTVNYRQYIARLRILHVDLSLMIIAVLQFPSQEQLSIRQEAVNLEFTTMWEVWQGYTSPPLELRSNNFIESQFDMAYPKSWIRRIGVSWSRDHVWYLPEYSPSISSIRRIEFFWIRRIGLISFVVFGECRHRYAVSSLMDKAYWLSEQYQELGFAGFSGYLGSILKGLCCSIFWKEQKVFLLGLLDKRRRRTGFCSGVFLLGLCEVEDKEKKDTT